MELTQRKQWRWRLITAILLLFGAITSSANNETDLLALQSFKSLISDPTGALASWNDATLHFCRWRGVICGGRRHPQRVVALELDAFNLTGSISPHLSNLTLLKRLHLSTNRLRGKIPPELGRLSRMQSLNLSYNSLDGAIPANLSRCSRLRRIYLSFNMLGGTIPVELGSLSRLLVLNLGGNALSGDIPASFGNISSLERLLLFDGGLEGRIPGSLGNLAGLSLFQVSGNKLSGEIPSSLFNISTIEYFVAGENRLIGELPPNMFNTLPNIQMLLLNENQLDGSIPNSLPNASKLVELDLKGNSFRGTVPSNLGNLQSLYWINLDLNQLEASDTKDWTFLTSLTNCSRLGILGLDNNRLAGELPRSVANFSARFYGLSMGQNRISGIIPEGIGNLANLTVLLLNKNRLTGAIPASIGRLRKLQVMDLSTNNFTGPIPSSFGNLTQLNRLYLQASGLSGSIPDGLGSCKNMEELDLSYNELSGAIPKELVGIPSLSTYLNLSNNALVGSLPLEVGILKNLAELDISENGLSGKIPSSIGDCQSLEHLFMEGNFFRGAIPESFSNLKGLQVLDLSRNNLSGRIPETLGRLGSLLYLNLSFNDLEGEVPEIGVFRNASAVSVLGNSRLCGGDLELQLPVCNTRFSRKKGISLALKVIIPVAGVVLCLVILFIVFISRKWMKKSKKKSSTTSPIDDQFMKVSYDQLMKATNGFSSSNLIGAGSFGSVYKGIMDSNENAVAVKVLNLQQQGASKSFVAECEVLRNIRHRNLVKILTSCSSVDFKGDDFKALVLEFMPNGSLEKWLHPKESEHSELRTLSLVQRLNIAIDVASALEYLHHHGHVPIVHCDLKPSNVLLDDDMCAHVGDFGLARILSPEVSKPEEHQTNSAIIKGSIGYIAPEYGMGCQVSTHGDVYSYGILLLEMFTGKRPSDEVFKDGLGLPSFVEASFPDRLSDVVDPWLLLSKDEQEAEGDSLSDIEVRVEEHKCLVSVLKVGLICSKEAPRERMEMGNVAKEMIVIRETLHRSGFHSKRWNGKRDGL